MTETLAGSWTGPHAYYAVSDEDLPDEPTHKQILVFVSTSTQAPVYVKANTFETVTVQGTPRLRGLTGLPDYRASGSDTGRQDRPFELQTREVLLRQLEAENSTALAQQLGEPDDDLYETVEAVFAAGKNETFEDGMISGLSENLDHLVNKYGNSAIEVISHLITREKVNPEVASEALRCLGDIDHAPTYDYRKWLLKQSLSCSSAMVRDGAGLGISYMDDPDAIEDIKNAIEREKIEELRDNFKQVLSQLQETKRCLLSTEEHKAGDMELLPAHSPEQDTREELHPETRDLTERTAAAFAAAEEGNFEDGVDTTFSEYLVRSVETYGDAAVRAIDDVMTRKSTNALIVSEALQWLGRVDHPQSADNRFRILDRALSSPSVQIRAGAVYGLSYMAETRAIPNLAKAIDSEECSHLREDMRTVLRQLKDAC